MFLILVLFFLCCRFYYTIRLIILCNKYTAEGVNAAWVYVNTKCIHYYAPFTHYSEVERGILVSSCLTVDTIMSTQALCIFHNSCQIDFDCFHLVPLWTALCVLCILYNYCQIHFIYAHYQPTQLQRSKVKVTR